MGDLGMMSGRAPVATALAVTLLLACSSGGDEKPAATGSSSAKAADALMRSLAFEGGKVRAGDMPVASDDTVRLSEAGSVEHLLPGTAGLLPFDEMRPDAGGSAATTVLLQFEDEHSHVAVPVDASVAGPGDLNLAFDLGDDVCDMLCKQSFTVKLAAALQLKDGTVGRHLQTDLVLDCTKRGDAKLCADGAAPSDGKPQQPATDAAVSTGASPDAGTGAPIDVGGPSDAGTAPTGLSCADGSPAPASAVACDGVPDCADGSDELGCALADFTCPGGEALDKSKLCDGTSDCAGGLDEMVCVPCGDGVGVFSSFALCDGVADCADGTDEMGCDFPCTDGSKAPITAVCNGVPDCADGSDESDMFCNPMYPCADGTMSVPITSFCDGTADCTDKSDEPAGCPAAN